MKLTVKHKNTEITYDESDNKDDDYKKTSLANSHHVSRVIEVLKEMADHVKQLNPDENGK